MVTAKKEGFIKKITRFLKEVKSEMKKVTWPNRKELTSYTVIVIVSVFIVAGIIWILDSAFTGILGLIIK